MLFFFTTNKSFAEEKIIQNENNGIIALMYHRFDENKYPSTNIKMEMFKKHLEDIKNSKLQFIDIKKFKTIVKKQLKQNYILLTIDDAFKSFYINAWPLLKKNNIPFILFVNTENIGTYGYMNWSEIKEIQKSNLGAIGNHSHSHDYLVDKTSKEIIDDLNISINIFKKELGYSPTIFSYPYGEYSNEFKKIITKMGFHFAFGQHSGVIHQTMDLMELPRFPINEKYGEPKRFKFIISLLPFPYKEINPSDRYLEDKENPPEIKIDFFEDLINIKNIKCYSNEGNIWKESNIKHVNKNQLIILIKEKFKSERGRINCSLQEKNNKWRWLGIQYVIAKY